MRFDPFAFRLQAAPPELARPHTSDLLRHDEACPLQDGHMLLHPGEGHVEFVGQARDRGVRPAELLKHAAPRRIRQRSEREIEERDRLNHMVQCYLARLPDATAWLWL